MPTIDTCPIQNPTIEEIISALERVLQSLDATGPTPPGCTLSSQRSLLCPSLPPPRAEQNFPLRRIPHKLHHHPPSSLELSEGTCLGPNHGNAGKEGWEAHTVNIPSLTSSPTSADPGSPHSRAAWKEPVGVSSQNNPIPFLSWTLPLNNNLVMWANCITSLFRLICIKVLSALCGCCGDKMS